MFIDFGPQWDLPLRDDPDKLTIRKQVTVIVESVSKDELLKRNDVKHKPGSDEFVLSTGGYEAACRLSDDEVRVEKISKQQ